MNFNEIFFAKGYKKGHYPLFKRQKDITDLYETIKQHTDLRESSFRTLISKLSTGGRVITEKIKPILLEIILTQNLDERIVAQVQNDINIAIESYQKNGKVELGLQENENTNIDDAKSELDHTLGLNGKHVFLTDNPVEQFDGFEASEMRERIYETLFLLEEDQNEFKRCINKGAINHKYTYFVTEDVTTELWKKLFDELLDHDQFLPNGTPEERYNEASFRFDQLCTNKYLRIFFVPYLAAAHNLYMYNITNLELRKVFKFYRSDKSYRYVYSVPTPAYNDLYSNIYMEIKKRIRKETGYDQDKFVPKTFNEAK